MPLQFNLVCRERLTGLGLVVPWILESGNVFLNSDSFLNLCIMITLPLTYTEFRGSSVVQHRVQVRNHSISSLS